MPRPEEAVIEAAGLRKAFGGRIVLDGVSLSLSRGETLVVLGRSGTGKSVLLKVLHGLLPPDAGTVRLFGVAWEAADAATRAALRRRIGFLFQGGALFDSLSVFDNIAFPLRECVGAGEAEIRDRVAELLSACGLSPDAAEKMPAELSGGMRKRVALARALALSPDALFYDEPTTGLDPATSAAVAGLVAEMGARFGVAQIVVTHDIPLALRVAHRMALLEGGRFVWEGTPEAFRESADPRVRAFLGVAA